MEKQKTLELKEYCKKEITEINKKAKRNILETKNKKEFWQMIVVVVLILGFLIGRMS